MRVNASKLPDPWNWRVWDCELECWRTNIYEVDDDEHYYVELADSTLGEIKHESRCAVIMSMQMCLINITDPDEEQITTTEEKEQQ